MTKRKDQKRIIRTANMRLIEAEIRNYHETVAEMQELEDDLLAEQQANELGVRVSSGVSDPTPRKAIRLMTSAQLNEMRRRVNAIQYMLRVLEGHPEPARLEHIRLMYWDGRYTVQGICDKLGISERTYYYWRREALQLVADKLGWEI